jgi:TRAP-type mannitol/chloroaromatic compound transport system permease large subunit
MSLKEKSKQAGKMSEMVYDKMSSTIVSVVYFVWGFITGVVSALVIKMGLV